MLQQKDTCILFSSFNLSNHRNWYLENVFFFLTEANQLFVGPLQILDKHVEQSHFGSDLEEQGVEVSFTWYRMLFLYEAKIQVVGAKILSQLDPLLGNEVVGGADLIVEPQYDVFVAEA